MTLVDHIETRFRELSCETPRSYYDLERNYYAALGVLAVALDKLRDVPENTHARAYGLPVVPSSFEAAHAACEVGNE